MSAPWPCVLSIRCLTGPLVRQSQHGLVVGVVTEDDDSSARHPHGRLVRRRGATPSAWDQSPASMTSGRSSLGRVGTSARSSGMRGRRACVDGSATLPEVLIAEAETKPGGDVYTFPTPPSPVLRAAPDYRLIGATCGMSGRIASEAVSGCVGTRLHPCVSPGSQ